MGRRLSEGGFRKREEQQAKLLAHLIEDWAYEKFCYHIEIFGRGAWSFTMGSQETSNGFIIREEIAHRIMKKIRAKLKLRPKYFHYFGSHDWGFDRKMHLHIVLRINSRKPVYWKKLERVLKEVTDEEAKNIETYLVKPSKGSDLSKNQVLYPLKVKDFMIQKFIPRKPFTSDNFDFRKARAAPIEKRKMSYGLSEKELKDIKAYIEYTGGGVSKDYSVAMMRDREKKSVTLKDFRY